MTRPTASISTPPEATAERLLAWYDRHRRALPWRARAGRRADPYRVWLSEVMLQQTTVAAVVPYFEAFVRRWPDVAALAAAPLDDVLHGWQGLGYYARARNLHRCARIVAEELGGRFPSDEAALRRLPGIGPYTAAAVAAIAFEVPAVVVDGNVERVMARLFKIEAPLPGSKPRLKALAAGLTPLERPGDYAQAAMDLGATVCVVGRPRCPVCPWTAACAARAAGTAERLPRRGPRAQRPIRRGVAFWLTDPDGAVLLRRRPPTGLLGGMMEVPSTAWRAQSWDDAEARDEAPAAARWQPLPGLVRHGFTHFRLELAVWTGRAKPAPAEGLLWCPVERLDEMALPTVMKKVVAHALGQNERRPPFQTAAAHSPEVRVRHASR